jgi:hypothetical protein
MEAAGMDHAARMRYLHGRILSVSLPATPQGPWRPPQ